MLDSRARSDNGRRRPRCWHSPEPLPVPPDYGLRLHDDQGITPVGPPALEEHPQYTISSPQPWSGSLGLEHAELLAESQVLKGKIAPGLEQGVHEQSKGC